MIEVVVLQHSPLLSGESSEKCVETILISRFTCFPELINTLNEARHFWDKLVGVRHYKTRCCVPIFLINRSIHILLFRHFTEQVAHQSSLSGCETKRWRKHQITMLHHGCCIHLTPLTWRVFLQLRQAVDDFLVNSIIKQTFHGDWLKITAQISHLSVRAAWFHWKLNMSASNGMRPVFEENSYRI